MGLAQALKSDKNLFNLPNCLTLVRIALLPVLAILLAYDTEHPILKMDYMFRYSPGRVAAVVVLIAGITDLLDGYFARRWKIETVLGKFLDPLADKLFLLVGLVMLMELGRVRPWLVILLLSRELVITGLRGVAAGEGIIIAADKFGKWKYIFQLMGLGLLTWYGSVFTFSAWKIGIVILYIALAISLISGFRYLRDFLKAIARKRAE